MSKKAPASSSLSISKDWDRLELEERHLSLLAGFVESAGHALTAQALAQKLGVEMARELGATASPAELRVKKYDHRCNYEEGERVLVDNRYGKSLAIIVKVIRQSPSAFCDKAFLEFENAEYKTRWEEERSTPYFAIHSGRTNAPAEYVTVSSGKGSAPGFQGLNATAIVKLSKAIDRAVAADVRFAHVSTGWNLASALPPDRPHISAEPGGASASAALSQGCYKAPILQAIDEAGEATIEEIKKTVQGSLKLSPADWEADHTGKIVWLHRLHAAIKHLKRVGLIDSPRREVYRRIIPAHREKSA